MSHWIKWAACAAVLGLSTRAWAASATFSIHADGIKEVSATGASNGDPDGTAVGTLTLDDGTGGTTGQAIFNIVFSNVDFPIVGYHIHQQVAGKNGSIVLDFQAAKGAETFRDGNNFNGTVTGLNSATIDSILANPTGYYLNFHNQPFPAGAVREQLPEPGSLALVGLGGLLLGRRRRA
jgi:hypothetical protein